MSSINEVQKEKYIESENKRFNNDLKEMRTQNNRVYESEVGRRSAEIDRVKSDFETQLENLKNEREQKLTEIRSRQKELISEENSRLEEEISSLKSAHHEQVSELKKNHEEQIRTLNDNHKKTMESADRKFQFEKNKNSSTKS